MIQTFSPVCKSKYCKSFCSQSICNDRGTVPLSSTTQQILLLSLLIGSVSSWIGNAVIFRSKVNGGCRISLVEDVSLRKRTPFPRRQSSSLTLTINAEEIDSDDQKNKQLFSDDTSNLQWQLFGKYHAHFTNLDDSLQTKTTSWVGKWITYDYVGDPVLETMPASVNYIFNTDSTNPSSESPDRVHVTHSISSGSTASDCETCFDDPNSIRIIPVASYTPDNIISNSRLGSCGMVVGPSIIRSTGTMATELILAHTTARIRIVFQHAPVWARGTEPGSCPPHGLKLIRCLLARETLTTTFGNEEANLPQVVMPGSGQHPIFDRSVSPFDWHKKWSGTSWTWGPEAGDRGWGVPELEIGGDDWHGCAPVEAWNLRLPGGVFIQLPRVITGDVVERCRLAWMPNADTLLRFEAGVMALRPILDVDEETIVGFEPPVLASLRCDVLENSGELEGVPSFVKQELEEGARPTTNSETTGSTASQSKKANGWTSHPEDDDESNHQAIHQIIKRFTMHFSFNNLYIDNVFVYILPLKLRQYHVARC